jgi:hypothetical protein
MKTIAALVLLTSAVCVQAQTIVERDARLTAPKSKGQIDAEHAAAVAKYEATIRNLSAVPTSADRDIRLQVAEGQLHLLNSEYISQLADLADRFANERGQQATKLDTDLRNLDAQLEREVAAVNDIIVKLTQGGSGCASSGWNQPCPASQDKLAQAESLRRGLIDLQDRHASERNKREQIIRSLREQEGTARTTAAVRRAESGVAAANATVAMADVEDQMAQRDIVDKQRVLDQINQDPAVIRLYLPKTPVVEGQRVTK